MVWRIAHAESPPRENGRIHRVEIAGRDGRGAHPIPRGPRRMQWSGAPRIDGDEAMRVIHEWQPVGERDTTDVRFGGELSFELLIGGAKSCSECRASRVARDAWLGLPVHLESRREVLAR